jgi:hypothetical protein
MRYTKMARNRQTFLKEIAESAARIILSIRQMRALRGKLVFFSLRTTSRLASFWLVAYEQVLGSRLNETSSGSRRGTEILELSRSIGSRAVRISSQSIWEHG